jgi:pilus assembly protein CpaD
VIDMKHRNAALSFPAIALVLGLAGCGQMINDQITYATWKQSPPDAAPLIAVKPVRFDVTFAGHDGAIDAANETALNEFLATNRIVSGNTVDLAIGPVQPGDGAMVVKRVDAVESALARRGIAVDSIKGLSDSQPGTVGILGKMVTVTPPACPGYNAPIHMNTEIQPVIVTGCSNEANLDLMVANPADLAAGRPLPPADGEALALSVQRYRQGKVPPLVAPITTSLQ